MIKLSKNEEIVLRILGDKPLSLEEIADKFYHGDIPFEGTNLVGNFIRRIRRKCEFDPKTLWTIHDEIHEGKTKVFWRGKK